MYLTDEQQAILSGSKGETMAKKICPVRTTKYERHSRIAMGHVQTVAYIASISV